MSVTQLIDFTKKIPENLISGQSELFKNEKLTDIQNKFH